MRTACAAHLVPASIAAAALLLVSNAAPASAQSFLQTLFGGGQSSRHGARPLVYPGTPAALQSYRSNGRSERETARYAPLQSSDTRDTERVEGTEPGHAGGEYRTLCVRTCDGYYFPISNSAGRARFMRDAAQCRASCGEDARLFYLPAGSDNMSTMIDLAGRSYVRMPNAFKYRKSLTDGCSCRPMPWSEAELRRHRRYAAVAALADPARPPVETTSGAAAEAAAGSDGGSADGAAIPVARATDDGQAVATPSGAATPSDAAAVEAEAGVVAPRASRGRPTGAVVARTPDRPSVRRQVAVARGSGGAGGGGLFGASWLSAQGGGKYTWPGDPPRR